MGRALLFSIFMAIFTAVPGGRAAVFTADLKAVPVLPGQGGPVISLDLKGADIAEVFRILSLKSGVAIVPTKDVTGRVSVFLNKVTFAEALNLLLRAQDLACERKGGIISVMTAAEYLDAFGVKFNEKRRHKSFDLTYADPAVIAALLAELKSDIGEVTVDDQGYLVLFDAPANLKIMEETIRRLDQPRRTRVFDIGYASLEDMKTALDEVITPEAGEVVIDEESGKLFVSDLPGKLEEIEKIVEAFDEEEREVFIQGEIVELTLTDEFERGVDWQKLFNAKNFDELDLVGEFSRSLTAYQQLSVGTVDKDSYNLVMQYLQSNADVKILSRPALTVVNNKDGALHLGSREAYVVQTTSQGETTVTSENVEFIDVGLKVEVTPRINRDGFIVMKIKPEISSVRATLTTSIDSEIPLVDTSEVETIVKVKDGQMLMIAGFKKVRHADTFTGVPFLGRLPLLGLFFGGRELTRPEISEFLVFLTPKITKGAGAGEGRDVEVAKLEAEILKRKTAGEKRPGGETVELRYETCPLNLECAGQTFAPRPASGMSDFDEMFLPEEAGPFLEPEAVTLEGREKKTGFKEERDVSPKFKGVK